MDIPDPPDTGWLGGLHPILPREQLELLTRGLEDVLPPDPGTIGVQC